MDSIKQKNLLQTELWNFTKKLRRLSVNEELGTSVYNFIIFKAWKKSFVTFLQTKLFAENLREG